MESGGFRDRLSVLAAAALFATGGAAIKLSTLGTAPLAGLRCGIAAIVLLVAVPRWRRGYRLADLGIGLAYAATLILFVAATQRTTAANAIFLQSTAPLFVLLLAPRLLAERVDPESLRFALGLAVGLVLIFLGTAPPQHTAPDPITGNALGLAAGVAWAFTLIGLRATGRDGGDPGPAVVAGNAIAFVVCTPWLLPLPAFTPIDLASVLYLGVIQVALAYVLLIRGIRTLPALEVSLLILLEPVLNTLFSWLVHGESPGPLAALGGACILSATAHHSWRARGQEPVEV